MMLSRRKALQECGWASDHAGLLLDRYLYRAGSASGESDSPQAELVKQVTNVREPKAYKLFFTQWQDALTNRGAVQRVARTKGRLILNLGAESVIETSLALHRTYGMPYLPGSALKGLAAAYARQYLEGEAWQATRDVNQPSYGEHYKTIFGTPKEAGYITFFDALYLPGSGLKGQALYQDIITVHHPDYYQGQGSPPADWDSPTPVPFVSATGHYLIALHGPPAWVNLTFEILALALDELGIGAKTSSGYGRMALLEPPAQAQAAVSSSSAATASSSTPTTGSRTYDLSRYQPGHSFAGEVSAVSDDEFQIQLPNIPFEVAIGVIARGPDVPNWTVRAKARVEIVRRHERPDGMVIFELKRAPKK
ncbi:type III-B CRISPR module RAMP protein Cmr6 [Candidatus Chloroploca sp. Khr17]|uniref:type III-B CRISPR module RAMP protein Cmr6 n=1 Tax=Candidatus Chloroploca sp. Khr17 TaxID=2496869 RepID=UPI00196A6240|nr:type III-B CRISPR module RAMP protein Cmr6 [Candidatus Chloroploca sp. Khr17]